MKQKAFPGKSGESRKNAVPQSVVSEINKKTVDILSVIEGERGDRDRNRIEGRMQIALNPRAV